MTAPRIGFVGTDTAVGKTTLLCVLLEQAQAMGISAVPYKPAQSHAPDEPRSDVVRLREAAGLSSQCDGWIGTLEYDRPLAPGLAEDPTPFLLPGSRGDVWPCPPLTRCVDALAAILGTQAPALLFVELAGGLWVPMPGGSWQPQWIRALVDHVVVVGRAGLGTINHTLSTIDWLQQLGLPPRGFFLSETAPPDPSNVYNPAVIAAATGVPHLGTLAHGECTIDLLSPLLRAIS
ncbi:MAG: dethiobiotin synthase [Nannocystaceae bacterium]